MISKLPAGLPIPVIELEKFILRPLALDDVEEIYQIYSDKEAMKFRAHPPLQNREEAKTMIRNSWDRAVEGHSIRWGIEERSSRNIIGTFYWIIDRGKPVSEIGYSLNKEWWNKGWMTEIAATMINFLFEKEGVRTILAKSHEQNLSSIRVLGKLGFRKIGDNEKQIVSFRKDRPGSSSPLDTDST